MAMGVCISRVAEADYGKVLSDRQFAQAAAEAAEDGEGLLLDSFWEPLFVAVTGHKWKEGAAGDPLGRAVRGDGGEPIDAVDCGWGPGRLLTPAAVRETAAALAALSTTTVAQRLLADSGKTPASTEDAELIISDEFELFDDLKDFFSESAEDGCGLLFTFV